MDSIMDKYPIQNKITEQDTKITKTMIREEIELEANI